MSHRTKKSKLDNSLLDDDLLNQSQHDLNQLTENQFDSNSDNSLMAKYNNDLSPIHIPTLMNSSNKSLLNHIHNQSHINHEQLAHGHDNPNHADESALVQEQINAHNAANAAASAAVAAAAAAAAAAASVAAHYGLNNQSGQISTQDQDQNQGQQQNRNQNIQQQQQQLIQQQYHLQQIQQQQQQQQHLHQQQHHHQHLQNLHRQSSQQNYSDQYDNRSPIPIQPATNILRSKNDQLQLTNDELANNLKNIKSNDITNGMGDPSEYLITPMIEEQEFNNVDVLKEFVKEFGKKNEFGIAIAHSNSKAIYFTCELGGSYRKKKNKKVLDEFDQKQIGTKKIKCPFAMVAHFSKKKKFWTLRITQNRHNHPKLDPLINFPMLRKRSNQVNNTIKNLYLTGDKPSVIHQKLSSMFPDLVIKREDIYNEIRILKKKGLVPPSNELRARKSVTNSNEINIATNLQEQFQQQQQQQQQHQHQQQQHIHAHQQHQHIHNHQQHQHQLQLQQQHHHQFLQQDQQQQQVADSLWPNLDDNKKDMTNEAAAAVAAALKDTETAAVVAAAAQAQAQAQAQNQINSQNQNQNQTSYDGYVENYETKGDFGIDERLLGN